MISADAVWPGLWFVDPEMLAWALLVPLALIIRRRRGPAAVRFGPAALLNAPAGEPSLPTSFWARFAAIPVLLQALGLLLVVVALARPVHRNPLPLTVEGIDILLAIDVSSSMRATDLDPANTRLDVVRDAAARCIADRPDDRIGLLTFARFADLRCPPTLDHGALLRLLAEIQSVAVEGPEDATAIGAAVARAAQDLAPSPARSRIVVLLSDGEENVATLATPDEIGPEQAAQLARAAGVRVHVIAAGSDPGGTKPGIDTTRVRRLAEATQGHFYEARDARSLLLVYASISELERVPLDAPRFRIEERFLPFLIAGLALMLCGPLLRSTLLEVLP